MTFLDSRGQVPAKGKKESPMTRFLMSASVAALGLALILVPQTRADGRPSGGSPGTVDGLRTRWSGPVLEESRLTRMLCLTQRVHGGRHECAECPVPARES